MTALLVVTPVFVSACGSSSSSSSAVTTLVVTQPTPTEHINSVSPAGPSIGDINSFEAPIYQNGRLVGELSGVRQLIETSRDLQWVTKDRIPGVVNGVTVNEWSQSIEFYFGNNNSLVVTGQRLVAQQGSNTGFGLITSAKPQYLAVTGGTGIYRFAHGELKTLRNSDGSYTQTFELQLG